MKKITVVLFLFTLFFLTSCAQKVVIKALEPAQVDRISKSKKVAVLNFKNDRVGLSRKIEAELANFRIDNKSYFTIVSRRDIETIIREQKLQSSGLTDEESSVKVGELIGAEAIISGDVRTPTKQESYFYEPRVRCANAKCSELAYYKVRCKKRIVGLAAEIRVVDISRGDVIFADILNKNSRFKHCSDDANVLPSVAMAAQNIAIEIAKEFAYKLTPHYRYFSVTLLDEPDLDYTSEEKKLLEFALDYIKHSRYDKAEKLLMRLIDLTDSKSYVAFYNLGVIKEAQGKYQEAKEYYEYADNLMIKPVEEINEAVYRINILIAKREKTLQQLGKK